MSRKKVSQETIAKTEVLLDFIKDAFQSFSYKDGNQSKIMVWAEGLEPVIDWTVEGVLDYIRDNRIAQRKEPPHVADVYNYALAAKNRADAKKQFSGCGNIDPDDCPSYVNANKEISEEEQLRNEAGHYAKLQALEDRLTADQKAKGYRSWRTGRHFPDKDFSSVQDIPFVPDEEDLPK